MEQINALLAAFHQTDDNLKQARLKGHQIAERLTHLTERNHLNHQRIWQAEIRINQLLVQPKPIHHPSWSSQDINSPLTANSLVEQLQQQIQQRSELLRRSAHDLKSNFGLIQSAASLLVNVSTDEEQQAILTMLQRNVQQATQLFTQLLDVTRLEAGQEQQQLTRFDITQLLGDLIENLQPLADERGLWLRQQGVRSLWVEGDSVKLYRIAQNLLLNAIQYTRVGGVTVGLKRVLANQQWQLSVTDTGPGLSERSHPSSGEGIGLLIVKELCALLVGQLSIEELNGGGTRFTLSFPLQYPD